MTDFKKAFTFIYDNKIWGEGSGGGSSLQNNGDYIDFLHEFLLKNKIKSVVDFGCGDWQFSRHVNWCGAVYLGIDTVQSVVDRNNRLFSKEGVEFHCFDNVNELGAGYELLLIKDVFQHWKDKYIIKFLDESASNYKYILCTNTINGSWQHETQKDVLTRPISATIKPLKDYGFEVVKIINTNPNDIKEISLLTNNF